MEVNPPDQLAGSESNYLQTIDLQTLTHIQAAYIRPLADKHGIIASNQEHHDEFERTDVVAAAAAPTIHDLTSERTDKWDRNEENSNTITITSVKNYYVIIMSRKNYHSCLFFVY